MRPTLSAIVLAILAANLALGARAACAADELDLERLALCQDSWLDWKSDPARRAGMVDSLRAGYVQMRGDTFFVPKTPKTVLGLAVNQVFPQSIAMAVGFSVVVNARFEVAKSSLENKLGKPLQQCETSDGMKACELELAPQKSIVLMAEDRANSKSTLVGCAYYYEK
jgi:hypothetical protein